MVPQAGVGATGDIYDTPPPARARAPAKFRTGNGLLEGLLLSLTTAIISKGKAFQAFQHWTSSGSILLGVAQPPRTSANHHVHTTYRYIRLANSYYAVNTAT
jgi:hypothetical protein